jgi:hypothetical protein
LPGKARIIAPKMRIVLIFWLYILSKVYAPCLKLSGEWWAKLIIIEIHFPLYLNLLFRKGIFSQSCNRYLLIKKSHGKLSFAYDRIRDYSSFMITW